MTEETNGANEMFEVSLRVILVTCSHFGERISRLIERVSWIFAEAENAERSRKTALTQPSSAVKPRQKTNLGQPYRTDSGLVP